MVEWSRGSWLAGKMQLIISTIPILLIVSPGQPVVAAEESGVELVSGSPTDSPASRIGVFRAGTWYFDINGNGVWNVGEDRRIPLFGMTNDQPVVGDWNGDGWAQIGVFRAGKWYLDSNGNGAWDSLTDNVFTHFGMAGDLPVAGDWNGDGKDQIGVFRGGRWYLDSNGNGAWDSGGVDAAYSSFGLAGDLPVTGDWDGDGKDQIGVLRGGRWYLDSNGNGAWDSGGIDAAYSSFGMAGDLPVTGDWDGDGKDQIGVFRGGRWYLDANGNSAWDGCDIDFCSTGFGVPGDKPVAGMWLPHISAGESTLAFAPNPSGLINRNGFLFWTEDSEVPIKKIKSGGGVVEPLASACGVPYQITVIGEFVYWRESNSIYRSRLDGTEKQVFVSGINSGTDFFSIIHDDNYIYYVNETPTYPLIQTIERISVNGGNPETLVQAPDYKPIKFISQDHDNIYWIEEGVGPITLPDGPEGTFLKKISKAGGVSTVLVNGALNGLIGPPPPGYTPGSWRPRGVIISGGYAIFGEDKYQAYRFHRIPVAGGQIETILDYATDELNYVKDLAADSTNLFWVDRHSVKKLSLSDYSLSTLQETLGEPLSIQINQSNVYWTESSGPAHGETGSINMAPKIGGEVVTLLVGGDAPRYLSLDETHLYWTEGGAIGEIEGFGRVAKMPIESGKATTLALLAGQGPIAVSDTSIFLVNGWTIKKFSISGGVGEKLLTASDEIFDIDTDGTHVYWIDRMGNIFKCSTDGINPVQLNSVFTGGPPGPLQVSNGYVYWIDHYDKINKVSTSGGNQSTVIATNMWLSDLVVVGDNIFFSNSDTSEISKLSVNGGESTFLAYGSLWSDIKLASDGANLYWIDQNNLGKVSVNGGNVEYLKTGLNVDPFVAPSLSVDDSSIYWTETLTGEINSFTPK